MIYQNLSRENLGDVFALSALSLAYQQKLLELKSYKLEVVRIN